MRKKIQTILVLFFCLSMCLSLVPAVAAAEDKVVLANNADIAETLKGNVVIDIIELQPQSVAAVVGATVSFVVKVRSDHNDSYQWYYLSPGGDRWTACSSSDSKTDTLTMTVTEELDGFQFYCCVSNFYGYQDSSRATLTVIKEPSIAIQPESKTLNAGQTACFSVTATGGALNYQWQVRTSSGGSWNNSGMTGATTDTLTVEATKVRSGYQYRCKVSNVCGTVVSSAATLTVLTPPAITTQPSSINAAVGATVKFTVAASGGGLSYQWQFRKSSSGTWSNSTATGCKTATLTVEATTARSGYQYRCKVTNAAGSATSSAATLTVGTKPTITTQPKSISITPGVIVPFTVKASGTGLTYQWQFRKSSGGTWSNSTATGAKTATLSIEATEARSGYQYRCKVTNAAGAVYSKAATLTVVTKPTITTQPKDQTALAGATVTFTVKASGGGLSYQWQFRKSSSASWSNSTATGAKTATLTIEATAARSGYQYRCVITNAAGKVISGAATLTVVS